MSNKITQAELIIESRYKNFDAQLGYKIEHVEPGKAVFSLEVKPEHLNPMGTLHGGVLLALADAAGGTACCYEPVMCPTLEGKLNFLKACFLGDKVTVEGKELRHGKTILSCEIKAWNQQNELVAAGLFTYFKSSIPIRPEPLAKNGN